MSIAMGMSGSSAPAMGTSNMACAPELDEGSERWMFVVSVRQAPKIALP